MSQALADAYLCLVVSLQPCMVPLKACGTPGSLDSLLSLHGSLMCLMCLVSVSLVHLVPMVPGTPLVVYLVPVVSAKKHLTMHVLHYKNK